MESQHFSAHNIIFLKFYKTITEWNNDGYNSTLRHPVIVFRRWWMLETSEAEYFSTEVSCRVEGQNGSWWKKLCSKVPEVLVFLLNTSWPLQIIFKSPVFISCLNSPTMTIKTPQSHFRSAEYHSVLPTSLNPIKTKKKSKNTLNPPVFHFILRCC